MEVLSRKAAGPIIVAPPPPVILKSITNVIRYHVRSRRRPVSSRSVEEGKLAGVRTATLGALTLFSVDLPPGRPLRFLYGATSEGSGGGVTGHALIGFLHVLPICCGKGVRGWRSGNGLGTVRLPWGS
jgi:hypothetical protein